MRFLQSGKIAGDGNWRECEGKLAEYLGTPYEAATAEFSRSIEMAIRMGGLGPGDSILLSPQACLATTVPILETCARPVWCNIERDSGNLQPGEILQKYSGSRNVEQSVEASPVVEEKKTQRPQRRPPLVEFFQEPAEIVDYGLRLSGRSRSEKNQPRPTLVS
jgi:hypothetical protein